MDSPQLLTLRCRSIILASFQQPGLRRGFESLRRAARGPTRGRMCVSTLLCSRGRSGGLRRGAQQIEAQQGQHQQDQHQHGQDLLHPQTGVELLLQPGVTGRQPHELVGTKAGINQRHQELFVVLHGSWISPTVRCWRADRFRFLLQFLQGKKSISVEASSASSPPC